MHGTINSKKNRIALNPAGTSIVFHSSFSAPDKPSATTVPPFDFVRNMSFRSCITSGMYEFYKNLEATSNPRDQKDVTKQFLYSGLTNRSQFNRPGDLEEEIRTPLHNLIT